MLVVYFRAFYSIRHFRAPPRIAVPGQVLDGTDKINAAAGAQTPDGIAKWFKAQALGGPGLVSGEEGASKPANEGPPARSSQGSNPKKHRPAGALRTNAVGNGKIFGGANKVCCRDLGTVAP